MSGLRRLHDPRRALVGIGWRLTVSYALVVVAAVLALSIAAAISALSQGEEQVAETSVAGVLAKNAAAAGSFLAGRASAGTLRYFVLVPTLQDLAGRGRGPVAVGLLDAHGRLVAAESCTRAVYQTSSSTACHKAAVSLLRPLFADVATRRLLERAALGTASTGSAAGRAFAAAPILAGGKQQGGGALVAAFAGAMPVPPGQSALTRFWSQWHASLPKDWLWLAALTILLGTAVGALLSHQHVRRVTRIGVVARSWSRGDLTATADASRRDELGRLAADLNQMAEQLRNLLDTRSRLATEQERRRVQRDLHDGIKQELFATAMQLAAARASLDPEADAIAAALDEAQASNRRAQHELAALLDQAATASSGGLETALAGIADRLALTVNLDIRLEKPLSPPSEEALYRVAQEALTNIRRHAGASAATVTLASSEAETRLEIRDDGHGFQLEEASAGMGLQTMRERVESCGGRLTVESGDTGTTLTATLPSVAE